MLWDLPPDILSPVTDVLLHHELALLWLTGDSRLLARLRISVRKINVFAHKPLNFPAELLHYFPMLKHISTKNLIGERDEISRTALHNCPKTVTSLDLTTQRLFVHEELKLSDIFPDLKSLQIMGRSQLPSSFLLPWPRSLETIRLQDCMLENSTALLVDLPDSLTYLQLPIFAYDSEEPIKWPSLVTLKLNLELNSLRIFSHLPSSLENLQLYINAQEDCREPKLDFWKLLPASITKLIIDAPPDLDELISDPTPSDLARLTRLRHFDLHKVAAETDSSELNFDSPKEFWSMLPSLVEAPFMTGFRSVVTDSTVTCMRSAFRKAKVHLEHTSSYDTDSTALLSLDGFLMLPSHLTSLEVIGRFSNMSLNMLPVKLPESLLTLTWTAMHRTVDGKPFVNIFALPRGLTQLKLTNARLSASDLSSLPHLRVLHASKPLLPEKYVALLPRGLVALELRSFVVDSTGATDYYQELADSDAALHHLWNGYDEDGQTAQHWPPSLTSITFRVLKQHLRPALLAWLDKFPLESLPMLTSFSVDTSSVYGSSTYQHEDMTVDSTVPRNLTFGAQFMKRLPRSLKRLVLPFLRCPWTELVNLPPSLEYLNICPLDNTHTFYHRYFRLLPKSLARLLMNGSRAKCNVNYTLEDPDRAWTRDNWILRRQHNPQHW